MYASQELTAAKLHTTLFMCRLGKRRDRGNRNPLPGITATEFPTIKQTWGHSRKLWVITEADRSSTCILLPEEY